MRILIVHSFYRTPGGEDTYVRRQVDLLSRRNEVELLAEDNRALTESASTAMRMAYSSREVQEVSHRIADFEPDVIHVHNVYPSFGPAVHLAARRMKIPLVMSVHNFRLRCPNGLNFTQGDLCRRCERGLYFNAVIHECLASRRQSAAYAGALWLHRYLWRLERMSSLFIAPSNFMEERLRQWGLPPERIRLVRHFVPPRPGATPGGGDYGVYAGRLTPEKGVEVLIQALSQAGDPPFRLLGDGPLADELKSLAARLGLRNLSFLGHLPGEEAQELISQARYAVLPSLFEEPAGLGAIEPLAAGKPVLVSRRGALGDLVDLGAAHGVTPGRPEDLAAGLRFLVEDDDACVRLGRRGLELAASLFSPAVHLANLEAAYQELISRDAMN